MQLDIQRVQCRDISKGALFLIIGDLSVMKGGCSASKSKAKYTCFAGNPPAKGRMKISYLSAATPKSVI